MKVHPRVREMGKAICYSRSARHEWTQSISAKSNHQPKCCKRRSVVRLRGPSRRNGMTETGTMMNERYLTCGSFGKIYTAIIRLPKRDIRVAIKKIPLGRNGHCSALKEAEVLKQISHSNIVSVYDIAFHQAEMELWIVTEYLDGGSLRQYCTEGGRMEMKDKVKVSRDCWSALAYLHQEAKVTHKDIKPENILLHRPHQRDLVAKLCDFGLAKMTDCVTKTELTSITGTAMYFPPEYVESMRNPEKADVYSMGASLCELYSECYYWCHEGTDTPLTYPQIIIKLIRIWKQLKKGTGDDHHMPARTRIPDEVTELLKSAVQFDRHRRPSAVDMKEAFTVLGESEKSTRGLRH